MPETENKQELNINTNTTTNRLRLPLSSLLDRRASASTPNSTPTATSAASNSELLPSDSSPVVDHQLLLQRRGSASDINIGLNRTRAPSLAAIQERITRMKPDLLNTTNQNLENTPNVPPPTDNKDTPAEATKEETTQNKETAANPDPVNQSPTEIKQPVETLHPLQHSWTLYFDTRLSKRSSTSHATGGQAYEAGLQPIGTFQSVEQFCGYFNWTVTPSQMDMNSSVQLFKAHIKPMWEDPANSKGGKWTITMKSNSNLALLDKLWTYLVLGLVGEQIETSAGPQDDDFVCGAIVATRPRGNRIQIWVKEKDNVEKINVLGKRLISVLEITDHSGVSVEFSAHTGGSHGASRFISIQGHANSSSPRGASSHAHTPIMRPALEGMMMGGMGRALEEKGMGGGMMRRSNSAEVSQLGATRGAGVGTAEFGSGGGFRGMGGAGRSSQLSSHDPPIQNGVWRPNSASGPAGPGVRPPGIPAAAAPAGPPGMMASFMAANRRPQSAMTLPTLGSMGAGGGGLGALGAFQQQPKQPLPSSAKSSRQPSPAPPASAAKPSVVANPASASDSPHSRNPSPAPPAASLGRGILSGS